MTIVTKEAVRREVERITKANYGFEPDEIHILAAASLCLPIEAVQQVMAEASN